MMDGMQLVTWNLGAFELGNVRAVYFLSSSCQSYQWLGGTVGSVASLFLRISSVHMQQYSMDLANWRLQAYFNSGIQVEDW